MRGAMAQWVKALVMTDDLSLISRAMLYSSGPLASTCTWWHMCTHIHILTYTHRINACNYQNAINRITNFEQNIPNI